MREKGGFMSLFPLNSCQGYVKNSQGIQFLKVEENCKISQRMSPALV